MSGNEVERFLTATLDVGSRRAAARVLARSLPEGNRSKTFRRLHALMETGHGPSEFIEAVRAVLDEQAQLGFDAALRHTRLENAAKRQSARFSQRTVEQVGVGPHLWVDHERSRPSQITIVALTGLGHWKRQPLPLDLPEREWKEQVEVVGHFCRKWLNDKGPRCLLFGRVAGFIYRPDSCSGYRFSIDGLLQSRNLGAWQEPNTQFGIR